MPDLIDDVMDSAVQDLSNGAGDLSGNVGTTEDDLGQSLPEGQTEPQWQDFDPDKAGNVLFKVKRGDREVKLPYKDLVTYAEQGFDYTIKRQQDAEALRLAEQYKDKIPHYEGLVNLLRSDPERMAILAAMDNPQFREALRSQGFITGQVAPHGQQMVPPEIQAELNSLRSELQQYTVRQQVAQTEQRYNSLLKEYPEVFGGPEGEANQIKLQSELFRMRDSGEPIDVDRAFWNLWGRNLREIIQKNAVGQYVKQKTNQGPVVQAGGGTPSGAPPKPKNVGEAWAQADAGAKEDVRRWMAGA